MLHLTPGMQQEQLLHLQKSRRAAKLQSLSEKLGGSSTAAHWYK